MKPETIDTITRHLKGIVAALEKEKDTLEILDFRDKGLVDGSYYLSEYDISDGTTVISKVPVNTSGAQRSQHDSFMLARKGVTNDAIGRYNKRTFRP